MRDNIVDDDGIVFPEYGHQETDEEAAVIEEKISVDHGEDNKKDQGGKGQHCTAEDGRSGLQERGGGVVDIGILLFDTDMEFCGYPVLEIGNRGEDLGFELWPVIGQAADLRAYDI